MTTPVPLWSAKDIAAITFGTLTGGDAWDCTRLTFDGRSAQAGDLYVAIKGDTHDGHDYIAQAAANGAVAAMVERDIADAPIPTVRVRDAVRALEALGTVARRAFTGQAIAVTGSVGKTTTKEMLGVALSSMGTTHISRASYNNYLGVPFTLSNLPATARFGVFEMGMNHPFEITPLSLLVRPHLALITWVAEVHIEHMGSIEAIAHAKSEVFDGLPADGAALLPADNPQFELLTRIARAKGVSYVYGYGKNGGQAKLRDLETGPDFLWVKADIMGEEVSVRLGMGGAHHAGNVLGALLAAKIMGGSARTAAEALEGFGAVTGRGARVPLGIFGADGDPVLLVDESYNASPVSMRASIDTLALSPAPRVAVLGDMRELGDFARAGHEGLADAVRAAGLSRLFLCGPNMAYLRDMVRDDVPVIWAEDSAMLTPMVLSGLCAGDTVLVKGSLGSKMKIVVEALKKKEQENNAV